MKKQRRRPDQEIATPQFAAGNMDRAINDVVSLVKKEFGGELVVSRLSEPTAYVDVQHVVPTGLAPLDKALGIGGFALSRVAEIYGAEHSGKTTLAKTIVAKTQAVGVLPHFLRSEVSDSKEYDSGLGVQLANALGGEFETFEQVFGYITKTAPIMVKHKTPALYVWDSFAATELAEAITAGLDEEQFAANRARFMAQHFGKIKHWVRTGYIGIIIVNQLREKVGATAYQKQTYSPGGRYIRHLAHVRLEMTRVGNVERGDRVVGFKIKAKVVKNKMAPPFQEANLELLFNPLGFVDPAVERQPKRTPVVMAPRPKDV